MSEEFAMIIDVVREFGLWMVFAWLFVQERRAHDATRHAYFEDLRDLAGVKPQLAKKEQSLTDRQE